MRRSATAILTIALACGFLAACGGDDDDSGGGAAAASSADIEAFCATADEGLDNDALADATEELAPEELAADAAVVADALRDADGDGVDLDDEAVGDAVQHLVDFCTTHGALSQDRGPRPLPMPPAPCSACQCGPAFCGNPS